MIMPVNLTRNELVELIEDLDEIRTMVKDLAMQDYEEYDPDYDGVYSNSPIDNILSDLSEITERLEDKLGWREDEKDDENHASFSEVICGVEATP